MRRRESHFTDEVLRTRQDQTRPTPSPEGGAFFFLGSLPHPPRAWGDPRWQSRGICIASLASQEEERVKVLKKTPRKEKDLSRGQGDERTLKKRTLLI
jgi:hypothetical protein